MPKPLHFAGPDAMPLAELEDLLDAPGHAHGWQRQRLRRTLLDTVDRRLGAAACLLWCDAAAAGDVELGFADAAGRQRRGNGPAATLPGGSAAIPDARLAAAVAAVSGPRRLFAVAAWDVEQSRCECRDADGKIIGELVAERHLGADRAARTSVCAQAWRGYRDEFERHLADHHLPGLLAPRAQPPWADLATEAALATAPLLPRTDVALDPACAAPAALAALLARLRGLMQACEPGIVADLDAEFLHAFRITLRRVRTLLGALPPALAAPDRLRRELAWLNEVTGPVRDLDVWLEEQPPGDDADGRRLRAHLTAERGRALGRLRRALATARYARLQRDWQAWLDDLAGHDGAAPALADIAAAAIARRYRRLRRRLRAHRRAVPPSALHELRKDAKKLRYLVESCASLYPRRDVEEPLTALKKLQNRAGAICDRQAHARLLAGWQAACDDPELAAALAAARDRLGAPAPIDLGAPVARKLARSCAWLAGRRGRRAVRALGDAASR